MMKTKKFMTVLAIFGVMVTSAFAIEKSEIENLPFMKLETETTPTIVGVAAANENFTTLVTAVKAADLVAGFDSNGPFTVFAPINSAFDKLPEGSVAELLKPENKEILTSLLTHHVVSGKVMATDVLKAINEGNGSFEMTTIHGGLLIASLNGDNVIITDEKGNVSTIIITDVAASNGVIHAVDSVVMP
jgi:uncharacterized surface protein with fasciclin (FAS1) repeats